MLTADAVFEGGGIKAIGLVGALCCLEGKGYKWNRVAGTSAGAMIASMVAAGYKGEEMKNIIQNINYKDFQDSRASKIKIVKMINFFKDKGAYTGDPIEKYIYHLLKAKGKVKFKDIWGNSGSKLKIVAADITKNDMLILPDDLVKYNINPKEFEIARAVRMSIGIPFFFKPIKLKYNKLNNKRDKENKTILNYKYISDYKDSINNHEKSIDYKGNISYIVDGGILSNFPVWIFDIEGSPRWPTFGFKLVEKELTHTASGKGDFTSYTLDVINTLLNRNEMRYIRDKDLVRTISIPTLGVKTTEFNLSQEKNQQLFDSGYIAAEKFMGRWDFDRYIRFYRKSI